MEWCGGLSTLYYGTVSYADHVTLPLSVRFHGPRSLYARKMDPHKQRIHNPTYNHSCDAHYSSAVHNPSQRRVAIKVTHPDCNFVNWTIAETMASTYHDCMVDSSHRHHGFYRKSLHSIIPCSGEIARPLSDVTC